MATPSATFPASSITAAAMHLESFALANTDVKQTVLSSGDGFEIAAYPAKGPGTARIAAMSSSLQALSKALIREVGLDKGRGVIIETNGGAALVMDLDESLPRTSLAVIASGKEPLGKLLWAARNLCKALEKTLSQ